MNVLIACEFSGVVRDAFRELGHEAWSADLLEESEGAYVNYHLTGDCREWLDGSRGPCKWDLLIAHPPCTYLCNSGVRWLSPNGIIEPVRHDLMKQSADLFAALYWAPIPKVCIENPIMHKYGKDYLSSTWKVPAKSQVIQPWQFGHGETKATCLWIRGLDDLKPSKIVSGRSPRVHHASPGPDRWKERSRTLPGIAEAMAQQWGDRP